MSQEEMKERVLGRLRLGATRLRRASLHTALSMLMSIVPPRPHTLIHGLDSEENSLVAAVYLARHGGAPITLLCDDPARARYYLTVLGAESYMANGDLHIQQRSSLSDIALFVRSDLVLYTHGLLGSPVPRGPRFHVNLWHGNAPKRTANSLARQSVGANALCGPSTVWAKPVMDDLSMRPGTELLCGGPRLGSLTSASAEARNRSWPLLGLDPEKPTVLWLPTYRTSDRVAATRLSDGRSVLASADLSVTEQRNLLVRKAAAHSVQLAVKPHPLEAENPDFGSIPVLTNDMIWDSGISLYQLLGLADGMISDYSSVWVDCLGMDYPIGLFCPDLDEYVSSRGLAEPHIDVVAGSLMLDSPCRMDEFFAEVTNGPARFVADAKQVATALEFRFPNDMESAFISELRNAIRKKTPNSTILDRLQ